MLKRDLTKEADVSRFVYEIQNKDFEKVQMEKEKLRAKRTLIAERKSVILSIARHQNR